tara:strand:- start:383 stop:2677 length:2295 start_codon:yes stop_codon:yes gene_type:complete
MKKLSFALFLFCFSGLALAQNTVSGYITDASTGESLIGVNIFVPGSSYGTTTNTYGFYSLNIGHKTAELVVSYIGYQTYSKNLVLDKNLELDIELQEASTELNAVEITADEIQSRSPQMSSINLSIKDIKSVPAFLGEVDIIKTIQLLPGVQSGGEGTTGFYVRGGSPDQNLILLDGVPVYNASHLFGFFSVFNADAIKNVQLTKGGFPARYGGRLSSVLDISLKEGNMKEFHGEGSVGLISSKLTLEGPIWKDKTSYIISGRRTYIDVLSQPFLPADTKAGYFFGDLNAKVNHIFSRKDRLFLSYYGGIDKFYNKDTYSGGYDEAALQWGNNTGALRWNHLYNDKLFSNLTATYSQYEFSIGGESKQDGFDLEKQEYFSRIRDYGLRLDYEYSPVSDHNIKFGASYTHHIFKPGVFQFQGEEDGVNVDSVLNLSENTLSHDSYLYIEDDWTINNKWRINAGAHFSIYNLKDQTYTSIQPRVSARYLIDDEWSLKGSFASMTQFIHLLSNSGIGLPTDLWVSSTANVAPSNSHQVALGSTRNFQGNTWELSVEAYYKTMDNLIEYKEGASFISGSGWENNIEKNGKGEAYGAEFLIRKNKGKTTGWIGYTLAWTNRQFDNLNFGETFAYKYDRRHDISVVLSHKFTDKFDIGLTWVYGTGVAFTAPISKFNVIGNDDNVQQVTHYTERNGERLPAYHRLDLGMNFHKETSWGKRTFNISVYNAYNRQNPYFLYVQNQDFSTNKSVVKQVSLFPIIPSISYIFSF